MHIFAFLLAATVNVKTVLQKQNFAQIIRYPSTLEACDKRFKIVLATSSNRPTLAVTVAVPQGKTIEATSIAINSIRFKLL